MRTAGWETRLPKVIYWVDKWRKVWGGNFPLHVSAQYIAAALHMSRQMPKWPNTPSNCKQESDISPDFKIGLWCIVLSNPKKEKYCLVASGTQSSSYCTGLKIYLNKRMWSWWWPHKQSHIGLLSSINVWPTAFGWVTWWPSLTHTLLLEWLWFGLWRVTPLKGAYPGQFLHLWERHASHFTSEDTCPFLKTLSWE